MSYTLSRVNEAVRSDPRGFAEECDAKFHKNVEKAARLIAEHSRESRVILLSGPSGSGKTTTALKIEEQLEREMGIETHTVSMDDYFNTLDPETCPRDRNGAVDFESPFCLDIELLDRHLAMLDRGETIHIPKYEFARQMRSDIQSRPLRLGEHELAIFEGIHALNDIIVGKSPRAFKLYIAARSSLTDGGGPVFEHAWLRLCRRIVRDHMFRGIDATFTLKLWNGVRRGEKLYISPYKDNADLMFDSTLAFEFSVLKPLVVPLLEAIPRGTYQVVEDMLKGFARIEPMEAGCIAPDSLAREFIGGGTYQGH